MKKLKNWIVSSAKNLWGLNWEAKIGILFLIPPIIGVVMFICNWLFGAEIGFESFPESWNCIDRYDYDSDYGTNSDSWGTNYGYGYGWAYGWAYGYAATPTIPLYLGLMAIAGAYLIKGNLKKKE